MARLWNWGQMFMGYAEAKASGRHATPETLALRQLSCFGDANQAPCAQLRTTRDGRRYCGACGCGPKPEAILDVDAEGRSKLQFTKLRCPLGRPGFSNAEVTDARTG